MAPPVDLNASSPLMAVPREVRHIIFSHVAAARNVKPRNTLRYWFEKKDIQEQIAEKLANDPDANVTYVAGYNRTYEDSERELEVADNAVVDEDENDQDDEEDEGQDGEADQEESDNDDEQDEEDDDDAAADEADGDNMEVEDGEVSGDEDDTTAGATATPLVAQGGDTTATTVNTDHAHAENTASITSQDVQSSEIAADADMTDSQDDDENEHVSEDSKAEQRSEVTQTAATADVAGDNTTAAVSTQAASAPPAPEVVVIKPHHKWHHVSKFMHLTQCPPQTNLFLISKQLQIEVKEWFYKMATLKIDATASFLHFSFFELALTKLAEAPFSPMENIKKAEITFVWDTTWIRAEPSGFAGAVFPTFLQNRADFVLEILMRAPELEHVIIHWHDSANDDGAKQMRADTVESFILNLNAKIEIEDHYIASDAKPLAKSRAGKQRLEFKAIMDNGCQTF